METPKRRFTFSGLHAVTLLKIIFFFCGLTALSVTETLCSPLIYDSEYWMDVQGNGRGLI